MSYKRFSNAAKHFSKLIQFRQAIYDILGPVRDALLELSDPVLLTPRAASLA